MPVQTTYPGVYVEERPSGVQTIAGVSTSVTAFVGAAAGGPVDTPVRVFSFADYVRTFGAPLDEARPMGHAVQLFFVNGGSEAVVVRAVAGDARAAEVTLEDASGTDVLTLTARGKGAWATRTAGTGVEVTVDRAGTANPEDLFDLVVSHWTVDPRTNASVKSAEESYANLSMSPASHRYALHVLGGSRLVAPALPGPLSPGAKGRSASEGALESPTTIPAAGRGLRVALDFGPPAELVLFPGEAGDLDKTPDEIAAELQDRLDDAGLAAAATIDSADLLRIESSTTGLDSAVTVTPGVPGDVTRALRLGLAWGGEEVSGSADRRPADVPAGDPAGRLEGGSDGGGVGPGDVVPPDGSGGLYALGSLLFPRFNLLCLPGLTSDDVVPVGAAISYCRDERAFMVVDSPPAGFAGIPPNLGGLTALGEHGAICYPRLKLVEARAGGTTRTLNLPASGAVTGVMARIDAARGVWKAPAGLEAGIVGVNDLTQPTDDNVSGQLNPRGVNVLRVFPGAGIVVWGARTLKGDDSQGSEFKYVPVRRLTDHIASSLYLGTGFAVFEPNDPDLWGQLRLAVGAFMRGLFRQGAFQQSTKRAESDSFFVVCDETVNPQSEIDLGRVNVVVGFAPLKPAEFVIVTITQISQLEA
jgi:phage tail sheath protein FI